MASLASTGPAVRVLDCGDPAVRVVVDAPDSDAAWRTVWDMAPAIAVAVVKHNNPCGLAIGATAVVGSSWLAPAGASTVESAAPVAAAISIDLTGSCRM